MAGLLSEVGWALITRGDRDPLIVFIDKAREFEPARRLVLYVLGRLMTAYPAGDEPPLRWPDNVESEGGQMVIRWYAERKAVRVHLEIDNVASEENASPAFCACGNPKPLASPGCRDCGWGARPRRGNGGRR